MDEKRLQHLFRAYTRKGVYGGRIRLVILIKPKIPSTVYTADALRVRLRRIRASTQNDRVVIRFYPRATSSRAWGEEMPRTARRDMFVLGKRDIQKCDMLARLARYALRARKHRATSSRAWGGNKAPHTAE